MLRKSLVPLLTAIILGAGAAWFAQSWMTTRIASVEAEKRTGTTVVVAARDIAFGDRIGEQDVKVLIWPPESQPEGAIHAVTDVTGRVAGQKILAGEPVLVSRLTEGAAGSSLAAQIEPTHRAVSVRVNDVIGVAGFLLPGNRVDVLASRKLDEHRAQTRTVLQNIKVLAVDQTSSAEKDKPVVVRAVTLEVDPQQAVVLVKATEEGNVQLALRNPEEREILASEPESEAVAAAPANTPVTVAPPALEAAKPAKARSTKAKKASPPRESSTVTVIRQTQVGDTTPEFPPQQ